jgi:hypothetical protein
MQELHTPAARSGALGESRRTLVLVAGSGRSGTSLLSGILQRLGFHVPTPEVPADPTNPRGFAESQWAVDFHTRLLRAARVHTSDARPSAWAETARVGLDPEVHKELRVWLERQFDVAGDLVIKDPRLSWFLPLWRRCADEVGGSPRFVTMLRHPGAVVDSKQRSYGVRHGEAARAAGWVHQSLFTERATRESPRVFVRYDDLLEDWTQVIARVGEALDLGPVRDAPATSMRTVYEFVDRGLSRSRIDWGGAEIPERLRGLADEVWDLLSRLVDAEPLEEAEIEARLDELRGGYVTLYAEAEAIAHSSVIAATRSAPPAPPPSPLLLRLARRLPRRYRHLVPLPWRIRIARLLRRLGSRPRTAAA